MMDTIKLVVKEVLFEAKKIKVIRYIVNGHDFIEMVKKVELPFAKAEKHKSIAGGYEGLSPDELVYPSKHLLGFPEPIFESHGKVQLLTCRGCREPGCWPLFVRIKFTKDKIIWSDFEQPHRYKSWKYDKLSPFTFDRKQYEKELHQKS